MLERMAQVGSGAARAETRREWVRAEEERMKRDREAHWLARVREWAWFTNRDSSCDK